MKMMDWNERAEGGGYFNEIDVRTPGGKGGTKSAQRQQFLCPVTIRQILEASDEGLRIGNFSATMVTLIGVVVGIDVSSTKVKFILSDDTGVVECIEWLESDDGEEPKKECNVVENCYYQIYGCIKSVQGQRKIMVFKITPIKSFNEYTAFISEVISVNQYAEKINQMPQETTGNEISINHSKNLAVNGKKTSSFSPVHLALLETIRGVDSQIGWSKYDESFKGRFPQKQIDEALDFLVSEGHIYSTVDDDHFCTT